MTSSEIAALLATLSEPEQALPARIAAAHQLAKLGDPRSSSNDPITIPAGILHRKQSPSAAVTPIEVDAFSVDRYLVTVKAYGGFIDAGGYADPSLWSANGWAWREENQIDAPRFWDDDDWAPYLVSNHPVVGASAYEAEAYAAFRTARLPTSEEWERACRGDDARNFPWGDDWLEDACAYRGYGPRSTLPVGLFPRGLSPFGLHDMVGSVWQWTQDHGPRREGQGQYATVCGGAWNNQMHSIGACGRNAYPLSARFSNIGFRCVRDLPA